MKTKPVATPGNRPTYSLLTTQLVALAIFLVQASSGLGITFVKATYNGLFSEMSGTNSIVNCLSSGFLTLSVRENRTFTGKLYISDGGSASGTKYSLSGEFNAEGKKTLTISRKAALGGPLTVNLEYAPAGQTDTIMGSVSCTNWTAQLLAYQAYTSQSPQVGTYTLHLRTPAGDNGPDGIGTAKVSVSLNGKLTLSGKLADGTSVSQSLNLCRGGLWPLYASLYKGHGSIVGWVEFDRGSSLNGEVGWTKPAMPTATYYNQGFTNAADLQGLAYIPRKSGSRPLNFSKGLVIFSGGIFNVPFTNMVNLSSSGNVNANTSTALKFKINPATGQFSGKAELPGLSGRFQVSGSIFQAPNEAYGYFLANGKSGSILLIGDYP